MKRTGAISREWKIKMKRLVSLGLLAVHNLVVNPAVGNI